AVVAGQLFIPAEGVQRCRGMVPQRNQRSQQYEEGILRWAPEQHGGEAAPHEHKSQWSDEVRALYAYASHVAGVANIAPDAVRNSLIAAKVRSWGWSEASFCCYEWDKLPERVDQAIVKRHGAGASHGSRSAVATFREKYIWA